METTGRLLALLVLVMLGNYASKSSFVAAIPAQPDSKTTQLTTCSAANTEFKTCQSSIQPACDNRSPKYATKDCRNGCYCKEGYLRNAQGACIQPKDCPAETNCPPNATYTKLAEVCHKTCETQYLNLLYACQGKPGCDCDKGYIHTTKGDCILPKDCDPSVIRCPEGKLYSSCGNKDTGDSGECTPGCYKTSTQASSAAGKIDEKCPANATFAQCASNCGRSCQLMFQPVPCLMICQQGCHCKQGYVTNKKEECILSTDCPRDDIQCPPGQKFDTCATKSTRICGNSSETKTKACEWGCVCEKPLVYNKEMEICVQPEECPDSEQNLQCQQKDPHSEYKMCASSTRPTCENPNPKAFTEDCRNECRCKVGYYYDQSSKKCLTLHDCQMKGIAVSASVASTCPANSTYKDCASVCPPTCATVKIAAPMKCMACMAGCACNSGYVKNKDNQCILPQDCVA